MLNLRLWRLLGIDATYHKPQAIGFAKNCDSVRTVSRPRVEGGEGGEIIGADVNSESDSMIKLKVKVVVWSPDCMTTHVQQTLPFPWQGGGQCSLQLLIQPWICAPGTHYGWVGRGSVEYEVLPDTSTHGQHWESNPRFSDLECNAISTRPHAPNNKQLLHCCYV